jgi:predicted ABC-type sugar transport system permease subunit
MDSILTLPDCWHVDGWRRGVMGVAVHRGANGFRIGVRIYRDYRSRSGGVNVAGGASSIWGVLLGAILIGIINNSLNLIHVSPFWKLAIIG